MWVVLQSYVPKVCPHSFCYASTTAMLSSLVCLLLLSIAFFTYRTVLLASYWKFLKLTTCVSVSSLAPNPTRIQYNINALCNTLHTLLHLKLPSILYTFHALALIIIIIMYIYHALINALSAHMIHSNLNMIFYTHVKHSPTKTIYIKYYIYKIIIIIKTHYKHTHTHTHTHTLTVAETGYWY